MYLDLPTRKDKRMTQKSLEQISRDAHIAYKGFRYNEAFSKYKILAEEGFPECQTFVGWMYAKGEGVEPNYSEAIRWCRKAAEGEDPRALFYLAKVFILTGDKQQAFEIMNQAASVGYAPAVFRLGYMYEEGYYVANNDDKAIELYQEADRLGHLFGRKRLALYLIRRNQGLLEVLKGLYLYLTLLFSSASTLFINHDVDYTDEIRI